VIKKKGGGIFKPTGTSNLLLNEALKYSKSQKKILDLGCGSGMIGLSISKKYNKKIFLSDISANAVKLAISKSRKLKKKNIIKHGSLFEPWKNSKFDLIICDVAGVSEEISDYTPWYKNSVPNGSGRDGTENILKVIDQAKQFLNQKGKLIIAVISLSNYSKIKKESKKKFINFKIIKKQEWPLPKNMYRYKKKLLAADKKNLIEIKLKYNMIIFWTEIYLMWN
jgi:methylase of polypeptide subunit release factors